jgi:hypothetical protein
MYALALYDPAHATGIVEAVPFIAPALMERAALMSEQHGGPAILLGALSGVPYKIFAVQAGAADTGLGEFLLWSVPGRGVRFVLSALLVSGAVRLLRGRLSGGTLLALWLASWVAIYAAYWTSMPD